MLFRRLGGGWAAGLREMDGNGCKWIRVELREQKGPLFSGMHWKTRGFRRFGEDILNKKKKATQIGMTFLLVRKAGLEAVLCKPIRLRSTGKDGF